MPSRPPKKNATPQPLTTSARLGGIARESLEASAGRANLAGIAREALLVGLGLAGRITGLSSAKGSANTTSTGLVLQGRIAAQSAGKASGQFRINFGVAIKSTSSATCFFVRHLVFSTRATAMSSAKMLTVGQLSIAGRMGARSSASGLVYLNATGVVRQWGVVINTG